MGLFQDRINKKKKEVEELIRLVKENNKLDQIKPLTGSGVGIAEIVAKLNEVIEVLNKRI